jgi:hypothetical protein
MYSITFIVKQKNIEYLDSLSEVTVCFMYMSSCASQLSIGPLIKWTSQTISSTDFLLIRNGCLLILERLFFLIKDIDA